MEVSSVSKIEHIIIVCKSFSTFFIMDELRWSLLFMFECKKMNEDSISMHFIFIQVMENLYAIYLSAMGSFTTTLPSFIISCINHSLLSLEVLRDKKLYMHLLGKNHVDFDECYDAQNFDETMTLVNLRRQPLLMLQVSWGIFLTQMPLLTLL